MTKAKVILKKWRARIAKAKKRGHFTSYDRSISFNWSKCAVGERDCLCEKMIPKNPTVFVSYGCLRLEKNNLRQTIVRNTMHERVIALGGDFYTKVSLDDFKGALNILKRIELMPKEKFYR